MLPPHAIITLALGPEKLYFFDAIKPKKCSNLPLMLVFVLEVQKLFLKKVRKRKAC
jgi:hypothetical protein